MPHNDNERKPYLMWVCADCLMARESEPAIKPDREPWNLLRRDDEVTVGMVWGEHVEPDRCVNRFATDDPCDCETIEFSWASCEGCGSELGGSRFAYTLWVRVVSVVAGV